MDIIRFQEFRSFQSLTSTGVAVILEAYCYANSCRFGTLYDIPTWTYSTGTNLFASDREEVHSKEFAASYFDHASAIKAAIEIKKELIMSDPKNIGDILSSIEQDTEYGKWKENYMGGISRARRVLEERHDTGTFIQCRRCKSSEVDTEQKQTRSADEPMTIFCLCRKCGQRFRMD
jgi:DNA-directed RNA polymerase subunit M/transcription elongation factor TFIIS